MRKFRWIAALWLSGCICALAGEVRAQETCATMPIHFGEEVSVGRRALLEGLSRWYLPQIAQALGVALTDEPISFSLTEAPDAPPGVTLGRDITLSAPFLRRAPEDAGMVLHELTHVVQGYPGGQTPSWVVEGIADYVRDYMVLPEPVRQLPPAQADYRRGYTHAAALFHHLIRSRHGGDAAALIHPLNAACKRGENGEEWLRAHYGEPAAIAREMGAASTQAKAPAPQNP